MKYCWVKHRWQSWEQYTHHYAFTIGRVAPKSIHGQEFTASELRQRRICVKCGTMQDIKIADVELESMEIAKKEQSL